MSADGQLQADLRVCNRQQVDGAELVGMRQGTHLPVVQLQLAEDKLSVRGRWMGCSPRLLSPLNVPCGTDILRCSDTFKSCLLTGFLLVQEELKGIPSSSYFTEGPEKNEIINAN